MFALVLVGITSVEARLIGDAVERPGLASFSEQPDPVPPGAPGTIIKRERLLGLPFAAQGWRILYRSTDLNGTPIVVSGTVIAPLTPAPSGGRTVLSWGHPTTGSAKDCAPSLGADPLIGIEGLRLLLDRGYVIAATDYAGMGTDGPDSYLVGVTEGNNVLDAARAARSISEAAANDSVVLWGHSQGGQAVLFAAERAADYAAELTVEAVAVAAPAADLTALLDADIGEISGVTIGSYAFAAFASVYGPTIAGAQLEDILTPAAVAANPAMNKYCLLEHVDQLHAIGQPLVGDFVLSDPSTTAPWADLLSKNSAGGQPFDAPLFVAQGLKDELVHPADTEQFVEHERSIGVDVTYRPIPIATHATVAYLALPELMIWLDHHAKR
jgi:pimeloyl-ACP methyl ester carboxylesterase